MKDEHNQDPGYKVMFYYERRAQPRPRI